MGGAPGAPRGVIGRGSRPAHSAAAGGHGRAFDVHVVYSHDGPEPLGTAAALRKALPLLGEAFHVLYGDTYLRID